MAYKLPSQKQYVDAMREHWEDSLGNVSNKGLEKIWSQMVKTFNNKIKSYNTENWNKWEILQPPTGSGKTQGLAVYCGLLHKLCEGNYINHPGVLIVSRTIAQGKELAQQINKLAGVTEDQPIALTHNSKNRLQEGAFGFIPVLIITHSSFKEHLKQREYSSLRDNPKPDFFHWHKENGLADGSKRRLIVIDEALQVLEQFEITLDQLRLTLGVIPESIRRDYPNEIKILKELEDYIYQGKEKKIKIQPEFNKTNFDSLRNTLTKAGYGFLDIKKKQQDELSRNEEEIDQLLRTAEKLINNWHIYSTKFNLQRLSTGRLIIPEDLEGAVVMDATASEEFLYKLLGSHINLLEAPKGARNYQNVTLHYKEGFKVGKNKIKERARGDALKFSKLIKRDQVDAKTLVVCHEEAEQYFQKYDDIFETGHWWALDGKNDWNELGSIFLYSLPLLDPIKPIVDLHILKGERSESWDREKQELLNISDNLQEELSLSEMIVRVIQAINRIRCRRVIDTSGNCEPSDIYMLLGANEKTNRAILEGIQRQMQGIKLQDWEDVEKNKRKPRNVAHQDVIENHFKKLETGKHNSQDIREDLDIPIKTWENYQKHFNNTDKALGLLCRNLRMQYKVEREGKKSVAYLIKN